jgi:hypothetical protein
MVSAKSFSILIIRVFLSHGGGLGVDASLAKFIVTWARTCERTVLHLYAPAGDDAMTQITQLAQSAAGFFALIMCSEIHAEDHQIIDRREALQQASRRTAAG